MLRGRNFANSLRVDLDSRQSAVAQRRWSVLIGAFDVEPGDVRLVDSETLSVVVPATLALGAHDVAITTPSGARAALPDALTVMGETTRPSLSADVGDESTSDSSFRDASSGDTLKDNTSVEGVSTDGWTQPSDDTSGSNNSAGPVDTGPSDDSVSTGIDVGVDSNGEPLGPALRRLRDALVHRYSFEEAGMVVVDSVGGAHGTFVGGALDGTSGAATFGDEGVYIDLPNGLISGRNAVTLDVWLIWDVSNAGVDYSWQRIFDFGSSSGGEGFQGEQDTHLFLSPRAGGPQGTLHLAYRGDLTGSVTVNAPSALTPRVLEHVTASVDGRRMELFLNGSPVGQRPLDFALSLILDQNNWLGRSQVLEDPPFQGRLFEFRIYDRALRAPDVSASHAAGPDVAL